MEHAESHDSTTGNKRTADDLDAAASPVSQRPRLNLHKEAKSDMKSSRSSHRRIERWMTNCMTDDYVDLVGDIMYPKSTFGSSIAPGEDCKFPLHKVSSLGYLLDPKRRRTVLEKWSPYEVAVFEASITHWGKNFNMIQKLIRSKTCKEVIEFYYDWKKTSHYEQWKKKYRPYLESEAAVAPNEDVTSTPGAATT